MIFVGDLFSFYVFWELMVVFLVLFVWLCCEPEVERVVFRYFLVYVFGGLVFLVGILFWGHHLGFFVFEHFGIVGGVVWGLIFMVFFFNVVVLFLGAWFLDVYF